MPPTPHQLSALKYLHALQSNAYRYQLGEEEPLRHDHSDFRAEQLNALKVLDRGGLFEHELREAIRKSDQEVTEDRIAVVLDSWRRGAAQIDAHRDYDRILRDYADTPSPFDNPVHRSILKRTQRKLERIATCRPELSFADAIRNLNGRVTFSTLPMGQANARAVAVPGTDQFLVLFDPLTFDLLYFASNAFANAIRPAEMMIGAQAYMNNGGEMGSTSPYVRYDDESLGKEFADSFGGWFFHGRPPTPKPYPPETLRLAEHLRNGAVLFIAAHEYAHILLGHFQAEGEARTGAHHSLVGESGWKDEVAADWLGFALTDVVQSETLVEPVRFMGADFFFLCASLIDFGFDVSRTGIQRDLFERGRDTAISAEGHPSYMARMAALREWLAAKYSVVNARGVDFHAHIMMDVAFAGWRNIERLLLQLQKSESAPAEIWRSW